MELKHDMMSVRVAVGQAWNMLSQHIPPLEIAQNDVLELSERILETQKTAYERHFRVMNDGRKTRI